MVYRDQLRDRLIYILNSDESNWEKSEHILNMLESSDVLCFYEEEGSYKTILGGLGK